MKKGEQFMLTINGMSQQKKFPASRLTKLMQQRTYLAIQEEEPVDF
jgi:hypothetical protein